MCRLSRRRGFVVLHREGGLQAAPEFRATAAGGDAVCRRRRHATDACFFRIPSERLRIEIRKTRCRISDVSRYKDSIDEVQVTWRARTRFWIVSETRDPKARRDARRDRQNGARRETVERTQVAVPGDGEGLGRVRGDHPTPLQGPDRATCTNAPRRSLKPPRERDETRREKRERPLVCVRLETHSRRAERVCALI